MTTTKRLVRIAACPFRNKIETGCEQCKRLPKLMIIGIAAMLALAAQPVFGQLRIVGRISGTVEDQAGAVIPKAKVVLKDSKTAITRETVSSSVGTLLFPNLA